MIIACGCEHLIEKPSNEYILYNSSLISPLIGMVDFAYTSPNNSCEKLFELCNMKDVYNTLGLNSFKIAEVFYPYGIVIKGKMNFNSIHDIEDWLKIYYEKIKLRNIFTTADKGEDIDFDIASYPIIIFETNNYVINECEKLKIRFTIDYGGYLFNDGLEGIIIEDPVVIIPNKQMVSDSMYSDLMVVLKTVCVINSLGRKIRTHLARTMKENIHDNTDTTDTSFGVTSNIDNYKHLEDLQKACALINEFASANNFKTNRQKRIYDSLKSSFHVLDILNQVEYARVLIENMIKIEENKVSSRIAGNAREMEKTVFITGYIGVILSIFNFFPLTVRQLFQQDYSFTYPVRWGIYISIFIASIGFFVLLTQLYDLFIKNEVKMQREWKKLSLILTILIILTAIPLAVFILG